MRLHVSPFLHQAHFCPHQGSVPLTGQHKILLAPKSSCDFEHLQHNVIGTPHAISSDEELIAGLIKEGESVFRIEMNQYGDFSPSAYADEIAFNKGKSRRNINAYDHD